MIQDLTRLVGAAALLSGLSACYVVPIGAPQQQAQTAPMQPQPLAASTSARLYPSNDLAASIGPLSGTIVNHLDGRGLFNFSLGGETYQGEATRTGAPRSGTASAAGSRGGYMNCTYTLNNATQGTGRCIHSSGATFNMHIGQ